MKDRRLLDVTLLVLIVLAMMTLLASWHLAAGPLTTAVVLALAALKGRRILLDFLGLRAALPLWRGLVTVWVIGVASFAWAASAVRLLM
jgi:hypothetical protein